MNKENRMIKPLGDKIVVQKVEEKESDLYIPKNDLFVPKESIKEDFEKYRVIELPDEDFFENRLKRGDTIILRKGTLAPKIRLGDEDYTIISYSEIYGII